MRHIPFLAAGLLMLAAAPAAAQSASGTPSGEQASATDLQAIAPAGDTTPCSERYRPVGLSDLDPARPAEETLRDTFDPRAAWGLGPNVDVLETDPGTDGPVIRVRPTATLPGGAGPDDPRLGGGFIAPVIGGGDRACLQYKVRFPYAFSWTEGGQLPGLYGGAPAVGAAGDGSEPATAPSGFTLRFAWREDGEGELAAYIANADLGNRYATTIGTETWSFRGGVWHTLEVESAMNTPGRPDGVARVWVDGELIFGETDVVYRQQEDIGLDGLLFSVFFENPEITRGPPDNAHVDFADVRVFQGGDQSADGSGQGQPAR